MHTVILGAGVSGLSAAYGLSQISGETYSIYEQQARSGGYCQSQRVAGFTYDIVSHVLHLRTKETQELVRKLLGEDLFQSRRSAWIYFRGRYVPYPFQTHLGYLPFSERTSCLAGYGRAWWKRQRNGLSEPKNFEEWVRLYLGDGIARHFMFPYNTKLWGKPPAELSVDWLRPFVPRASWREVLGNLVTKSVSEVGYNASFYYPKVGGIQALVDRLEARIEPVRMNHQAVGVDLDRKIVRFQNGQEARYDTLISTIPLKGLALRSTGLPEDLCQEARELHSTSLLSLTYCVRRPLPHSFHWLYFPEPQYPFFRIVFPSNICPSVAPQNTSVISVEISRPEDKTRLDALEAATRKHLVALGFLGDEADICHTSRHYFDHAYPVHDLGRQGRVSRLVEFFKAREVWTIGRFGAWKYSSIDDAIAEGLCAAQEAVVTVPARAARLARAASAGAD